MPERTAVAAGIQIGSETTPGTSVPATTLINSFGLEVGDAVEMQEFRPTGQKYPSIITPGKEWTEFDISGVGSYSEVCFLLASIMKDVTPTVVETTGRNWTFNPSSRTADTVQTYTIEQGDSTRAHKFTHGLFTEVGMNFTRDGVEVSGAGIGQQIQDAITLTATPTALEEKPILPTHVDVFVDSTYAALGTTKMLRALSAELTIGDRFNPLWVLNSTLASFATYVETVPSVELKLMMEADAQGMALLTAMRAGSTRFIKIRCTSTELAGSTLPYEFAFNMAGKVSDVDKFSDEDGVFAIGWTFKAVHDVGWGQAMYAGVLNKTATLP